MVGGVGVGVILLPRHRKKKKKSLVRKRDHDYVLKDKISQSGRISLGFTLRSLNAQNRDRESFVLYMCDNQVRFNTSQRNEVIAK